MSGKFKVPDMHTTSIWRVPLWPAELGALFIVILFAAANLMPIAQLWGINYLKYLPPYYTYIALALALLLILPYIQSRIISGLDRASDLIALQCRAGHLLMAGAIMASLFLFWSLRSATTFLGDGHLRTNQIQFGRWFLLTEFFDFGLHAALYNLIFKPLGSGAVQTYQAMSILCGGIFLVGIWRLSSFFRPARALLPFIVLISSGMTAQFFGYIESYSLLAALSPFVLLAGLKAAENSAEMKIFAVLIFTAALVHSLALFIFGPSLACLYFMRRRKNTMEAGDTTKWIIIFSLMAVAILIAVKTLNIDSLGRFFLALFPSSDSPQAILTSRHFFNLLNWTLFSALPIFLLVPLIMLSFLKRPPVNRRSIFLLSIILPSSLFILFFTPQLGGPRDWDLFSLPLFALLMGVMTFHLSISEGNLPRQIIPIAFLSLTLTISFALINNSTIRSADRFAEVIEVGKIGSLFKEYNLLSAYASDHPDLKQKRFEFTRKAWEAPPLTKADSTLILNKLSEEYYKTGDWNNALRYINLSLETDSLNALTYQYLIKYYRRMGASDDLKKTADLMAIRFSRSARGQMDAGMLFMELGDTEHGSACLERAYNLDSNDVFVVVNCGVYGLRQGDYREAVRLLNRAVIMSPDYFNANFNLGLAYGATHDGANAAKYLSRAQKLAATPAESLQVAGILKLL